MDHAGDGMDLFFTPDTCALASLIVCYDAGLDITLTPISFAKGAQKDEAYLAVNPKARVPALRFGPDILTETPAILAYLAQIAPEAALAPSDPMEFAQAQSFNAYLCSTVHVAHAHRMRGSRWVDGEAHLEALRRKVPQSVAHAFTYIEEHALRGPFVLGERYSICDPYLFTLANWMEGDGVDPAQFPRITAHRNQMAQRATVRRALAVEAEVRAALA
ncbi:glutathione S-transferase [Rubricella aquisinus]|uniref:Glutathione S-transferase n=1 Tax=Rubricella aquisinus TaxID=2028108 RepID=A0A840WXC8_9RHOB|nr:glutathione S-transferase [Rubricella aquisinus]MBB5515830.1 glutathione S-transferase [Rubricella aquisinus]